MGCYGDGGAIFTNDDALAQACREIRVHGQSKRYVHNRKLASGQATTATRPAPDPGRVSAAPQSGHRLLPAADFRLYAVATRYPDRLMGQLHPSARRPTAWPGVYDLTWGHRTLRLIVLNAITQDPRNAPWEIFASEMARLRDGLAHFQPRGPAAGLLRYHLS